MTEGSEPSEYFSMLRSNSDVIAEYSSFDELKRMRQAYLVHTLDHVIQERRQVFLND